MIDRIKSKSPSDLALSTVTMAEIYYGIEKSPNKKRLCCEKFKMICTQLEIFPFDEPAALKYGTIRARLEKQGMVISERNL